MYCCRNRGNIFSSIFQLIPKFKGVRKKTKFSKEYLLGQFGGVPRLGNWEEAIQHGR